MSAIEYAAFPRNAPAGVQHYNTKIKVLIHSHNNDGVFNVSDAVESCNVSKNLKGVGNAQVTLTADFNYFKAVFPNDYINIYFDTGTGDGWTRTFFGFVDRISESYAVSENGTPVSRYVLACTDFQKAIEQTQIYFNPHIANRPDLLGRFIGANNIGGIQLMMSGINVSGSPADIVQSSIMTLLGFGTQFTLPPGYAAATTQGSNETSTLRRIQRSLYLEQTLAEDVRVRIQNQGGFRAVVEQARETALQDVEDRVERGQLPNWSNMSPDQREAVVGAQLRSALQRDVGLSAEVAGRVIAIAATQDTSITSLLDVMDIFTFVEDQAMDGWTVDATVWQQQGSLMNFLVPKSHEAINELFFDLRPVTKDSETELVETGWSRDADEIAGNLSPRPGSRNGVQYVPAMVMREYPFSTVENVDASNVTVLGQNLGIVPFGAVFSDKPNLAGRHVVPVPALSFKSRPSDLGMKHLDVAVLTQNEIRSSDLGRSDHDHFNLTEFYSDHITGSDARFFLHDVVPITSPIHIVRNGLRVRTITTPFSRYNEAAVTRQQDRTGGTTTPEDTTTPAPTPLLPEDPNPSDIPTSRKWRGLQAIAQAYGVGLNVYLLARTIHSEFAFNSPSDPFHPAVRAVGWAAINMTLTGHRPGGGRRPFANGQFSTTNLGLSIIPQGVLGAFGGSRPQSTARFPGDAAPTPAQQQRIDTLLAEAETLTGTARGDKLREAATLAVQHTQELAEANRFTLNLSSTEQALVSHYFDLAKKMLRGDADVADPAPSGLTITFVHSVRPSEESINNRARNNQIMYEIPPPPWSTRTSYVFAEQDEPNVLRQEAPQEESFAQEEIADAPAEANPSGSIDTSFTRGQLIRWALLHDHWYQHNLEYLSGSLAIRPAPEIRVGYRLDIADRNLSFYVEGVSHNWQYPNVMSTNLQVTRGQPSDPYPIYVYPQSDSFGTPRHQRQAGSRLARSFNIPDLQAVRRAVIVRDGVINPRVSLTLGVDDEQAINSYGEKIIRAGEGAFETGIDNRARELTAPSDPTQNLAQLDGVDSDASLTDQELSDAINRVLDETLGGNS